MDTEQVVITSAEETPSTSQPQIIQNQTLSRVYQMNPMSMITFMSKILNTILMTMVHQSKIEMKLKMLSKINKICEDRWTHFYWHMIFLFLRIRM